MTQKLLKKQVEYLNGKKLFNFPGFSKMKADKSKIMMKQIIT